jgi:hypothetical protein
MQRTSRYLLFYAILAVGLAYSWGQLGRRTQLDPKRPVHLMSTESDCQPWHAPCAAYAKDFALVLGPAGTGLRLVGSDLPNAVEISAKQFGAGGQSLDDPTLKTLSANAWQLDGLPRQGRLRINLLGPSKQWSAEFPLQ